MSIDLKEFESVDGNYENCPCDEDLLVWTGDSFETEHVVMCDDTGCYYPANGTEFTHFLVLVSPEDAMTFFRTIIRSI